MKKIYFIMALGLATLSQDVRIFLTKTTNLMFHQLNFIRLRQDSPV